jgi:antitoxin ParD1/3/4
MQVSLTPELTELIQEKIKGGSYHSTLEVIGEALRLLDERDRTAAVRLVELKQKIQIGIAELDRGEGLDGEDVFAELEADIQQAEAHNQQQQEIGA